MSHSFLHLTMWWLTDELFNFLSFLSIRILQKSFFLYLNLRFLLENNRRDSDCQATKKEVSASQVQNHYRRFAILRCLNFPDLNRGWGELWVDRLAFTKCYTHFQRIIIKSCYVLFLFTRRWSPQPLSWGFLSWKSDFGKSSFYTTLRIVIACRVKRMTCRLESDRWSSAVRPRSLREV